MATETTKQHARRCGLRPASAGRRRLSSLSARLRFPRRGASRPTGIPWACRSGLWGRSARQAARAPQAARAVSRDNWGAVLSIVLRDRVSDGDPVSRTSDFKDGCEDEWINRVAPHGRGAQFGGAGGRGPGSCCAGWAGRNRDYRTCGAHAGL